MGRTGNGDGSIASRETKTRGTVWDVQASVRMRSGITERVTKRGLPNREAAVNWRDEQKRKARLGQLVRTKPQTLPDLCRKYMAAHPHLAPSTRKGYSSVINRHVNTKLDVRVENLDTARFQLFLDQLASEALEEGYSGSGTVKQARRIVTAVLRWAADPDVGLIGAVPIVSKRLVDPTTVRTTRAFTGKEIKALMKASLPSSGVLWRMLLDTACRKGEILGLDWEDIDWDNQQVVINKIATPESNYREVKPRTKTKVQRTAPLSKPVMRLLTALRDELGELATGALFKGPAGRRASGTSIHYWWHRDLAAAGLTGRVPHELRHTWATNALRDGVDAKVVAEVLGHSDVRTTLRIYRHVSIDDKRAAVKRVSKLLA